MLRDLSNQLEQMKGQAGGQSIMLIEVTLLAQKSNSPPAPSIIILMCYVPGAGAGFSIRDPVWHHHNKATFLTNLG